MASDYLLTDDLTILLSLIAATVFLLNNLYKPQPLVHPILLGRQSDVGRSRNPGESAIYRNYSTGLMGRFPQRPGKDVHILADLVRHEIEAPRTLWSTKLTNTHLQDRAAAFGTGLLRLARLQSHKSNVLVLLNDCLEFIVADLALASHSIISLTLSSATLLTPVLDSYAPSAIITHAFFLPQLLELIYETEKRSTERIIVVVGEPTPQAMSSVASNIKILRFADLEREGIKVDKIPGTLPKPSDMFTVSFYQTTSGQLRGAQLTHENVTAGVTAVRALLPPSHSFSPLDTIVSAHSMNTAYGRAVAYTAIYEGTSFASLPGSELYHTDENDVQAENARVIASRKYPIPFPTIMFIKPGHLASIVSGIISEAKKPWFLYAFAWRHKVAGVAEGFITNQSLWDRLVFDGARTRVIGDSAATLRAVVVSGGHLDVKILTSARIALSVPFVNAFTHPLVAAPVLASHALDLQDFYLTRNGKSKGVAPNGPPGINVEVKLVGVIDDVVEKGGDPSGDLFVRGPPVGKVVNSVDVPSGDSSENSEWVGTDAKATVQPNGSFQLL